MSTELRERTAAAARPERRRTERRSQSLRGLLLGSFHARRRHPRRASERSLVAVDWHHPQWLAIAILILLFSSADAVLTLELMRHGAYEANPLMAPLVGGSALAVALVKVGLTALGLVLLTQLARLRAFGSVPVGVFCHANITWNSGACERLRSGCISSTTCSKGMS